MVAGKRAVPQSAMGAEVRVAGHERRVEVGLGGGGRSLWPATTMGGYWAFVLLPWGSPPLWPCMWPLMSIQHTRSCNSNLINNTSEEAPKRLGTPGNAWEHPGSTLGGPIKLAKQLAF